MSLGTVLKLKVGDKSSALEVNDSTTIKDFVNFCSNAGLNATFDEKQQRFFLSSKDSGEENSFSLSANTYSSEGGTAITELNDAVGLANLTSSQKTKYNSIVYGAIASGTQISDDDKETLKSLAVSSADADAKSKATEFYRASLNKTYDISDEEKEKIKKKYESDLTLSGDDRTKAIADAIEKKKQSDIEEKLKTDEYKTKISEAVTKGITAEEVRKAGLAVNDDLGVEDPELKLWSEPSGDENKVVKKVEKNTSVTIVAQGKGTNGRDDYYIVEVEGTYYFALQSAFN